KIIQYNLQDSIKLCGSTNNIAEKMLESSIYVMTSHNECFPLVLLEAQACGLPIVSFNCPHGPKNIIKKDSGYLVEHYNNKEFADKLSTLMNDVNMRKSFGINARINSENFSKDKIMGLWINMFNEIV